jgi:transposase
VQALWNKKTNSKVSTRTIGRKLRKVGLKNCLARKKPLISPANKAARLEWCLEHASWTKKDWAKVLWSDESTFTQFQQSRCSRVWREPKDKWAPSCVAATVKHSPSRMHWGCFSRKGLGPLVSLTESVTTSSHVETLRRYALPTFKRLFPKGNGWFQEDNARPHKAKAAVAFRTEHGLQTLSWPAQSLDLNPIENLWAEVKKRLQKRKRQPSNLSELDRHVKEAWRAIPISLIESLVDSMPHRIQAVIAAEGGATKY